MYSNLLFNTVRDEHRTTLSSMGGDNVCVNRSEYLPLIEELVEDLNDHEIALLVEKIGRVLYGKVRT